MIPTKLKLSNFTSYAENPPELDFTKFKLAAISGLNGAGKSSLLDAITWCMWGTSRAGDSSDSLIHSGANDMTVEFSFELDNHDFTVKRRRSTKSGGSSALELWYGLNNLTEGTIKATQEKIINTLHLTFETFTNSSYLRQGHADEFTTKGPTDRKRILADILGLDRYDRLEEKAKEAVRKIQTKLQLLSYQILEIESELTQKEERSQKKKVAEEVLLKLEENIKDLENQLKNLRNEKEALNLANEQGRKLLQNYQESKSELEEIVSQGKSRKEKIISLEEKLRNLKGVEGKLADLKILQEEKEKQGKIRQKKLEVEKQLLEVQGLINLKKQEIEQIKEEVEKLEQQISQTQKKGAKCPTCGQEIGKGEKDHVHKTLTVQKQNLESNLKKIDFGKEEQKAAKLSAELQVLKFDQEKYDEISQKLEGLEKYLKQKEELIHIQATLDSEKKVISDLRQLFTNKAARVEKLEEEVHKLPDLSGKLTQAVQQINQTEQQLDTKRQMEKEARNTLGQITELISRTKQLEKVRENKLAEQSSLQKEKESYEELALAFGKKGIQAMIIESAIPEIEDEANKLLGKLSEGRMKIALQTQRETKTLRLRPPLARLRSGQTSEEKTPGIIETLDIIISDEMGERLYENFSGGEQFRINFAIRLAISKLLTHRAGARLQFLVIDEGFGSQDAPGRARLIEAIDAIKNDFEKILVITHIEELKEEFPVRIEVSKNTTGSTFEVVGV